MNNASGLSRVPWWAKIAAKGALSMLPVSYERLRGAVTGYHGGMEDPGYARSVFEKYQAVWKSCREQPAAPTLLELGPGGSLLNGIYFSEIGFETCFLVDVGDFASRDPDVYRPALAEGDPVRAERFEARLLEGASTVEALASLGIHYMTGGLASIRGLPDGQIDFSFSNAVLEHVRRGEFEETARQLARLHRPGSYSAHQIDYRDHLGGALNNLRIGSKTWESPLFPNSGFYTNRLRHHEVRGAFTTAGFRVREDRGSRWEKLPTPRDVIHTEFKHFSEDELSIWEGWLSFERS